MQDFEKLGVFYLGREYDLAGRKPGDALLLYDSKDLVTHAVCVGMTGSGKTGLCIALLEEAAIDGIPAIIIDPKGDLPNLLLTFPDLAPDDFRPWINEDEARRKNLSPEEFAARQAELWKNGLASWGQDGQRIGRLKDSAEFVIYTPGSSAALPISILKSFARPEEAVLEDGELFRERVGVTVTSLLGLLGIDADPIQSREHILLSTILADAWQNGRDVDLAALVHLIQQPPVKKVGVMDVESFFPSKDRFALAMRLNNLLAAPGFAAWTEGDPLDIASILYTPDGRPRHAIFSIAHLGDAERMFFVSLLLNQVLGWMRGQSGTTSLRAILYMDEIFGYFPPVSNPPSKQPLLTMLKQARAFGLGVVLATQNPVDLDYKGLANCGTWFIGRLQTDRDKQRVLDGLAGAAAGASSKFDRSAMESTLAGLGSRVFLMNNVNEDAPTIFETRWVMSYLRGPMTRQQLRQLTEARRAGSTGAITLADAPSADVSVTHSAPGTERRAPVHASTARPALPPGIVQFFEPTRSTPADLSEVVYHPSLLGIARVYFADARSGVTAEREIAAFCPLDATSAVVADFASSELTDLREGDLDRDPIPGASFEDLPPPATQPKSYDVWKKSFADWVYRTQQLEVFSCPGLKLTSAPGESEREFRARLAQAAREQRDAFAEKLRLKYASKFATLNDRIRRAELAVERERAQSQTSTVGTMLSVGSSILGAFLGRRKVSKTNLNKAAGAARSVGRAMEQRKDVDRAESNVAAAREELSRIETQFEEESSRHAADLDRMLDDVRTVAIKPKKTDIVVRTMALMWRV